MHYTERKKKKEIQKTENFEMTRQTIIYAL